MINLFRTPILKIIASSSIVLLLQACGGEERTTPYNPGTSSSSSSSSLGNLVSSPSITSGTEIKNVNFTRTQKQLVVMRTQSELTAIAQDYGISIDDQNFTNGQVVLIDLGDQQSCDNKLGLSGVNAHEEGSLRVKVTVNYSETAAQSTGCTQSTVRNFYFYYVQSRRLLVFAENSN